MACNKAIPPNEGGCPFPTSFFAAPSIEMPPVLFVVLLRTAEPIPDDYAPECQRIAPPYFSQSYICDKFARRTEKGGDGGGKGEGGHGENARRSEGQGRERRQQ